MVTREEKFEFRIRQEQAAHSVRVIGMTIVSNSVIALSSAIVIHWETSHAAIFGWLIVVLLVSLLRFVLRSRILSTDGAHEFPDRTIESLVVWAFVSGILWIPIPILFGDVTGTRAGVFVFFIMAGITAGSILQSAACARISLAFGIPVMAATLARLVYSGGVSGYVLAVDTLFFAAMLIRSAVLSERNFVDNQLVALEATELSRSLETANRALDDRAHTDPLTGLANRARFRDEAELACRMGRPVSVILLDVDEFKTINDTRGHCAGDAVLAAVASGLRSECAGAELPARLGGDEFIVLLWGDDLEHRTRDLADRLLRRFSKPLDYENLAIAFSCSFGVAMDFDGVENSDLLLGQADFALYRGKLEGRARACYFDAEMANELGFLRRIETDLPQALKAEWLDVAFQPQVAIATHDLVGYEALLRWEHPELGAVAPPLVVRAALRLHLSEQLISFVGRRVCDFVHRLDEAGQAQARVALNIAPSEFLAISPSEVLGAVTRAHAVSPERIEIEITEELLFDEHRNAEKLAELRRMGFSLALDDFGSGYSSIANLTSGSFDTLKIDRGLVTGIAGDPKKMQQVGAIIAVAGALGHRIVAEGIETRRDAEALKMLGCRVGQGWWFGKPAPASVALEAIRPDARRPIEVGGR